MQKVKVTQRTRKGSVAVMLDYHDGARRVQRVFGSATSDEALAIVQEEAEKEARRIEVQLMDGLYRPSVGDKPIAGILADYLEYVDASNRAANTKTTYKNMVARFTTFLATTQAKRGRDLTVELLVRFIRSQSGAPDTIRTLIGVMDNAFQRAVNQGDIPFNPCKHGDVKALKPQSRRRERTYTPDEFETLLKAAAVAPGKHKGHLADYFLLLGESGLRATEGLMLRWCDVNLDAERPFLRVQPREGWKPKTKTSIRRVPLSPRVDEMLRRRLRAIGEMNPTARVFPETMTLNRVQAQFENALKRAGLEKRDPETGDKLCIHALRHYYAVTLVKAGVDPASVRDLVGHGSVIMTDRYFTLPDAALFDAVAKAFDSRHKNVTNTGEIVPFSSENFGNRAIPAQG